MAYKLKIALGKRSYRKGPSNSKMKSGLKVKENAVRKRVKLIGRKLGS